MSISTTMNLRRTTVVGFICVVIATSFLQASDPPATQPVVPQLSSESSVDDVLDALEARGKSLVGLQATIEKADVDVAGGDQTARRGTVFVSLANDQPRMRVSFDSLQRNDNPPRTGDSVKQDYLLLGEWLIERNFDIKKVVRYQVRKPGEVVNLLSLTDGPFPLPVGQSRQSVYAQFDVKLLPTPEDRPGVIVLDLRPKPDSRLRRKFARIIVDVDTSISMPVRIETMDRDIDDANDPPSLINVTTLKDLKLNVAFDAAVFAEDGTEGWDVESKALND